MEEGSWREQGEVKHNPDGKWWGFDKAVVALKKGYGRFREH